MEQKELVEGSASNNQGFDSATALQIRLDTSKVLQDIENFLRGLEENYYWNTDAGSYQPRLIKSGMPKANARGIQAILNYCRSLINPQVVQGNYDEIRYLEFVIEKRIELVENILVNLYNWECSESDVNEVVDFIMNLAEPFLSRMVDNKERESYAQTIRTMESNRVQGGMSLNPFNQVGGGQQ